MARPSSPTVSRRELANTLRQMRQHARKTLEEAASALEVSAATLSRIETGVRVPRARDVKDLCEFYGITDATRVESLTALVADAKETGWWESYTEVDEEYATLIGLEAAATAIDQFESAMIPGFLQTPDYGRAYLRDAVSPGRQHSLSDHDIAKRIEVRTRRQQLLSNDSGVSYTAIIDEGALLRPVGGASAMREQLAFLLLASERSGTEILVLPLDRGGHPGQHGGFTVMTLPQAQVSDVVYVESLAGQLFLETPEELDRHRRVFVTLRNLSLDTSASQEALRSKMAIFGTHL
jgi:transcriptional regulator with XRE-family HTH domain